ncbi:MAG: ADP-ribosylation factor-like protein [Promethearchaeota archaeon]
MYSEENKKKIVLIGLDKAGKTSIVQSLQGIRSLTAFNSINPTKGLNSIKFQVMETKYLILDLGGQEAYRSSHLKKFDEYTLEANKVIFVIDIQDSKRYDLSVDYLKTITTLLKKNPKDIELSIFLHKNDPDFNAKEKELYEDLSLKLTERIKEIIPEEMNYSIFKTSIYTVFEKSKID